MKGTMHADGRDWINLEEGLARFGLARGQLNYVLNQSDITRRGPILTEGSQGSQGPEDYYDAQELEDAVKQYKQEKGLEE